MATLNTIKAPIICAAIASSERTTNKIETAIWKARRSLKYYAGEHLSDRDIARLSDDIADYMAAVEPQNCSVGNVAVQMLVLGHQASEYVVNKLMIEIIEGGIQYIADKKAEGIE